MPLTSPRHLLNGGTYLLSSTTTLPRYGHGPVPPPGRHPLDSSQPAPESIGSGVRTAHKLGSERERETRRAFHRAPVRISVGWAGGGWGDECWCKTTTPSTPQRRGETRNLAHTPAVPCDARTYDTARQSSPRAAVTVPVGRCAGSRRRRGSPTGLAAAASPADARGATVVAATRMADTPYSWGPPVAVLPALNGASRRLPLQRAIDIIQDSGARCGCPRHRQVQRATGAPAGAQGWKVPP